MSEFINTIDLLGDEAVIDSIIDRSITEFKDNVITTVGAYAFCKCNLETVDLPNVTGIGIKGFERATIAALNMPKLEDTGNEAFSTATLPDTLSFPSAKIANTRSFQMTNIKHIDLPVCTKINQRAFMGCENLVSVNIPMATYVDTLAFGRYGAHGGFAGTLIDLPACNNIQSDAFYDAKSLTAVILRSETVCTTSATAFNGTPIASGTGYIYVPGNLVSSYRSATNWSTLANQFRGIFENEDIMNGIINETIVDFEDDIIESIPNYGFYNYKNIQSVSSTSVAEVKANAFQGCTALKTVDFPNVTNIGYSAFSDCSALEEVNIPNVTNISGFAFKNVNKLTSIDVSKLTTLSGEAFGHMGGLKRIVFPELTGVGAYAFRNGGFEYLDFWKAKSFRGSAFYGSGNLKTIIIRTDTVATLGETFATFAALTNGECYFYVPRSLVDSYKVATNWSTYADQFRALEDYTVDGSTTGELDETKI